jgi:hypothetical protein
LACAAPDPVLWHKDDVQVEVSETRRIDKNYAEYRIEVRDAKSRYCYGSGSMGGPSEGRNKFREVLERDGFLFVPASCGGGNASKCQGWQAFALNGGLRWLGHLSGRWDGANVSVYEDGVFFDTGDMLEINDLVVHAQSPRYATAYTYADGRLRFDAARSWALNADAYLSAPDNAPGLLYKAGLAKLCGKTAELRAAQAKADKVLNEKGRRLFKSSLAQVKTANLQPNAFIPVGECPPQDEG